MPGTNVEANLRLRTLLLVALLLVAVGGWVMIANGALPATATGPVVVGFYLFLGLLVAVITFGVLKSAADIKGEPFGVAVQAGGPFAGVLLVVGGAVVAEKYRPQQDFDFTIRVVHQGDTAALDGTIKLQLGAKTEASPLSSGRASFSNIPDKFADKKVLVEFTSNGWRTREREITLKPEDTSDLGVEPVRDYCDTAAASKQLTESHEKMAGLIAAFNEVGADYVRMSKSGASEVDDKIVAYLKTAQGLADSFEKIDDCLDDVYQAERYADAAFAWTMAALHARFRVGDEDALDRLDRARAAETKARAFLKKIQQGTHTMRDRARERELPARIHRYAAYRLAVTDPVQHRSEILKLQGQAGPDGALWKKDQILHDVLQD